MNTYEQKRQARIDRLRRAATLCRQQAAKAHESAHKMAGVIPFGQPILVGHHSERRDRAYRARISRRFERSFELEKRAEEYERRLAAAESNLSISSDNPDAADAIREKIAKLEAFQEKMRAANKIIRKGGADVLDSLRELLPGCKVENLLEPDFCGRLGFADYQLTNNSANIRRLKKRLEQLEKRAGDTTTKRETPAGARVVDNVEENRLQVFFAGKPPAETRQAMKRAGFRWAPSNGCWQRMRGNGAAYEVKRLIEGGII